MHSWIWTEPEWTLVFLFIFAGMFIHTYLETKKRQSNKQRDRNQEPRQTIPAVTSPPERL